MYSTVKYKMNIFMQDSNTYTHLRSYLNKLKNNNKYVIVI